MQQKFCYSKIGLILSLPLLAVTVWCYALLVLFNWSTIIAPVYHVNMYLGSFKRVYFDSLSHNDQCKSSLAHGSLTWKNIIVLTKTKVYFFFFFSWETLTDMDQILCAKSGIWVCFLNLCSQNFRNKIPLRLFLQIRSSDRFQDLVTRILWWL